MKTISAGSAAREIRMRLAWTQQETAKALGLSNVHLSNIENGKVEPSRKILERFYELWGIDLYVFAWCSNGAIDDLPTDMQKAAAKLTAVWNQQINRMVKEHRRPFGLN